MADREVIIVDVAKQQQEQFQRRMAELAEDPLDRAKVKGGYYLNADGLGAHDANGNPIPLKAEDKKRAEELRKLAEQRAAASAPEEIEKLDSPEEVAERGGVVPLAALPTSGGTWTPAAVPEGSVLPDGTTSQPSGSKAGDKPAAAKTTK